MVDQILAEHYATVHYSTDCLLPFEKFREKYGTLTGGLSEMDAIFALRFMEKMGACALLTENGQIKVCIGTSRGGFLTNLTWSRS